MHSYSLLDPLLFPAATPLLFLQQFLTLFSVIKNRKGKYVQDAPEHTYKLAKDLRMHFLEKLVNNTLDDFEQLEGQAKKDDREHQIHLYRVAGGVHDFGDLAEAAVDQVLRFVHLGFLPGSAHGGRPRSLSVHFSDVPRVSVDCHAAHRHVLPIRNGRYYPSITRMNLSHFSLDAELTYDAEAQHPKYAVKSCKVDFTLSIDETERYKDMPVKRAEKNLKALMCQKALLETADFYGKVMEHWGDALSHPHVQGMLRKGVAGGRSTAEF